MRSAKLLYFLFLVITFMQCAQAATNEWVTLQNDSGKTITVKLLRMEGNTVHLKLQNGRTIKTSISIYDNDSQVKIRDHFSNLHLTPENFDINISRVNLKKKSEDKWGVLTKKYLQQAYKINLINRLPSSISDVKVEYLIFASGMKSQEKSALQGE